MYWIPELRKNVINIEMIRIIYWTKNFANLDSNHETCSLQ